MDLIRTSKRIVKSDYDVYLDFEFYTLCYSDDLDDYKLEELCMEFESWVYEKVSS